MADTYNVFISWSGERSEKVAKALYDWLPMVLQTAKPWMSKEDIEKGSRGLDEVAKALEAMSVGIICVTPENVEKPWILFESGALSKALGEKTRVCPYLFGGLLPENVKPPLGMFQATKAVKDDTRKLVGTVNRVLGGSLGDEKLDTLFERMWPELEKRLEAVPKAVEAAAPPRSDREMLAEILELGRTGANNDSESAEALLTVLRGVGAILERVVDHQVPVATVTGSLPSFWATNPFAVSMSAHSAVAEINKMLEEAEQKAARARQIAEILKEREKERAQGGTGEKKTDDEKK